MINPPTSDEVCERKEEKEREGGRQRNSVCVHRLERIALLVIWSVRSLDQHSALMGVRCHAIQVNSDLYSSALVYCLLWCV